MADNLKINIVGTLDKDLTKTEINAKIVKLQGEIDKLKINVQLDEKITKTLSDFSKAMENHKKIAEDLNRVVREEKTITKEADGVIKEKIKQHLKSGEVIEKEIERINKKNKATQQEQDATKQLVNELDKLGQKQKEITRQNAQGNITGSSQKYRDSFTDVTYNANKNGELTSTRIVQNLDQQNKAVETLRQRLLELNKAGVLTNSSLSRMSTILSNNQSEATLNRMAQALTRAQDSAKTKEQNTELEKQLELYKRNAQIQVTALQNNSHKILSTDQQTALQNYLNSVRALNTSTPQLQHQMRQLALDFREVSSSATTAAHGQMSVLDMFRTAMVKFPVWMGATTAFYGSLNLLKNSISIIVSVDERLTSLKKVMNDDTNFTTIMDDARISAEKFGKTISDVLDAYTEFAKQGYKQEDLVNLGDAGLIASNVGELSSSQAAQYLTSAMVQYSVATKDAIKVIDSWNNISNRNATTVEKLAQGMSKAGSTANAFGLDMDSLNGIIGTVTAATKQSGNEVGNFVKSVLPRLLGKPAQEALKSLNIDFLDKNTGDMRNVVDIYGEVAEKVQNISKTEKMAVMEGLAGKMHISRMTALIDHWDLFEKIVKESANSEGSASKENEQYMKSLDARIAKMKQSYEELALTMGKAFLTEGFIQSLEGLKTVGDGIASLIKTVGGLPVILTTASIAITLMSKNFKMLAVEGNVLRGVFAALGVESKALKIAIASTGVGAVMLAAGIGLEYLLRKMGESREKSEELERKNRELTESYKEHKQDIQNLTEEYTKLDQKIRSGVFDTKDIEKYHEVSNKLAELMPDLVSGEDKYGNKIIGSNEKLRAKIELLEKQTTAQEKLDAIQKRQDTEDAYNSNKKELDSSKTRLDNFFFTDENRSPVYSIKEAYSELEKIQNKLANGKKLNLIDQGTYKDLQATIKSYETLSAEVDNYRLAYQKSVMDMIDVNVKLDSQTGQTTKSLINDFTTFIATSEASASQVNNVFEKVLNAVQNDGGFKATLESYSVALKNYQNRINEGTDPSEIEKYKEKAISAFTDVKNVLLDLAESGKLDDSDLSVLSSQLDGVSNSAIFASVDLDKLSKSTGKSTEELKANLLLSPQMEDTYVDLGDEASDSASSIDDLSQALEDAKGNFSSLAQVTLDLAKAGEFDKAATISQTDAYSALASEIEPLNSLLETMAEGKSISAAEAMDLVQKESSLADAISIENGQIKINQDAVLTLRNAKISAYQDMINAQRAEVQNQASALSVKLQNYGAEIKAIMSVAEAQQALAAAETAYHNRASKYNVDAVGAMHASVVETKQYDSLVSDISGIKNAYAQLDKLQSIATAGLSQVGTRAADSSKADKAKKDKGSGSDRTVEIEQVDRYKMAMDAFNDSIKQSEFLTKRLDKTSSQYRSELEKQSKTYEQMSEHTLGQISALEKRNSAINAQIKALGNVNKLNNTQKETLNNLNKELEANTSEVYQLKDAWRGYQEQLLSMQDDLRQSISDEIAEEEAARVEILEKEIEDVNKQYEDQIALLQDKLDALDEIEETEDRIAKLTDKQNEIDKAKSDKRYSYITAQGEEILTYNKEQVSELEKERDEMVKEYERADLKKAMQDEINRLNKQKDDANKALQKRLDDFKKFWDKMVSDAKAGTLSFTTLQQAWQDKSISSLTAHVNATGGQLNNIGGMYKSLGVIATNMDLKTQQINTTLSNGQKNMSKTMSSMSSDLNNFSTSYGKALGTLGSSINTGLSGIAAGTKSSADKISYDLNRIRKAYEDAFNSIIDRAEKVARVTGQDITDKGYYHWLYEQAGKPQYKLSDIPKYHTGTGSGVGGESTPEGKFLNNLVNAKPNEQVSLLLKKEEVFNPMLPNVKSNIRNIQQALSNGRQQVGAIDQSTTNYITVDKVVANNPLEFMQGLPSIARKK